MPVFEKCHRLVANRGEFVAAPAIMLEKKPPTVTAGPGILKGGVRSRSENIFRKLEKVSGKKKYVRRKEKPY